MEYTTVAKVGDIPVGQARAFPVKGTMVGVFNVDGEFHAINDFCPHMGASLAEGHLEGDAVMCPWHAWRFCVTDGAWLDNPGAEIRAPAYAVRIEADEIQVAVPDPAEAGDGNAESPPAGGTD